MVDRRLGSPARPNTALLRKDPRAAAMAAAGLPGSHGRHRRSRRLHEEGVRMVPLQTPLIIAESAEAFRLTPRVLGIPYSSVEDEYVLGRQLGEGMSGVVRRCTSRRTGEVFACKTLRKADLSGPRDVAAVRAEVRAMRRVRRHGGVARMKAVMEDEKNVHIIMEPCEGGDLLGHIKQRKQFSEKEAAALCRQLLSVVQYCHAKGVVHRDLKPENILMMSPTSNSAIKVVDFGQAALLKKGVKLHQAVGTPYYVAPEVLRRSYGREADVWSLGVILYILLCGVPPFWAETRNAIFVKIKAGIFDLESGPWRYISAEAKDLVSLMLCLDPVKRITPEEAKEHPWIKWNCQPAYSYTQSSYPSLSEQEEGTLSDRLTDFARSSNHPSTASSRSRYSPALVSPELWFADHLYDCQLLPPSQPAATVVRNSSYSNGSGSYSSSSLDSELSIASTTADESTPQFSFHSHHKMIYQSRWTSTYSLHPRKGRLRCKLPFPITLPLSCAFSSSSNSQRLSREGLTPPLRSVVNRGGCCTAFGRR